MFETMLRNAFQDHHEEDPLFPEETLREKGVELHQFSPAFERKMEKLLRKARRKEWRAKHRKGLRQLAAMVVLVFLGSGFLVTQVDAIRIPVMNIIITVGDHFSEITLKDTATQAVPSKAFRSHLPTYIPDGFYVESINESKDSCMVFYEDNNNGYYSIDYYISPLDTSIDTENATLSELEIRDCPAVVSEKDEVTIIVWFPHGHEYILSGSISLDEMIQILGSIEDIS